MKFDKLKVIGSILLIYTAPVSNGNVALTSKPTWLYDINEAKELAKQSGKPILISFAGSDWCKPCILLTREVFENEKFISYAEENLVLVLADFPRNKKNRLSGEQVKHNEALAEQFNREGAFPLVVLVDAEGTIIGKAGYLEGGAENYITHLNTLLAKER